MLSEMDEIVDCNHVIDAWQIGLGKKSLNAWERALNWTCDNFKRKRGEHRLFFV